MTDPDSPQIAARRARKLAGLAGGFTPDPRLERALTLREQHPEQYAALPPSVKTAVGYYLTAKAAAGGTTTGDAA